MEFSLDIYEYWSFENIEKLTEEIFIKTKNQLPPDTSAKIFIKPNLNSTFNALTGNTTDLRLIAASLQSLKPLGYTNIIFLRFSPLFVQKLRLTERSSEEGV